MMNRLPHVSIIAPVHNEQARIREAVLKMIRYGGMHLGEYEILLVENGSTDETLSIARELSHTYRSVSALQVAGRSKAAAVRHGMLTARGEYRYMCDVDLSTPIDELSRFLKHIRDYGAVDIVIGAREHPDSRVKTSFKRYIIGRIFSLATSVFVPMKMKYRDTQCGFKLFNRSAAEDIFSRVECLSMAFDVEVLYLAEQLEYTVAELPVIWDNDKDSRVRLFSDGWFMLNDLMHIQRRQFRYPYPRVD